MNEAYLALGYPVIVFQDEWTQTWVSLLEYASSL